MKYMENQDTAAHPSADRTFVSASANADVSQSDAIQASPSSQASPPSQSKKTAKTDKPAQTQKDTTLLFAGDVYFSDYVLAGYRQSGIQGIFCLLYTSPSPRDP